MSKFLGLAVAILMLWTAEGRAVEIKNVRAIYGPFGAVRPDNKILLGDIYILEFDITNLAVDPKTGVVKYESNLQVFDPAGMKVFDKTDKQGVVLGLGGNTCRERAHVLLGVDKMPGKYKLVVTITDVSTKLSKQLEQSLTMMPTDFGLIHVLAPSIGFVGQDLPVEFALVGFGRDKSKMPKISVTTKLTDEAGKLCNDPVITLIPKDLPAGFKPEKEELIRLTNPILLNRPGVFTLDITALDEITKKTKTFTYKFKVLDASK